MSGGGEFKNPVFDDDYDEDIIDDDEDEEARLLPQDNLDDTFLASPLPADTPGTLRNEQARQDFYKLVGDVGWEKEHSDIDENSLIEHRATIHKDKFTGKVYIKYQGKDVKLTKKVGSGFAKPSTIAKNARAKGFDGNHFVRDVLGVKNYGLKGNTSMSQFTEAASMNLSRNTENQIRSIDKGEDIELEEVNKILKSSDELLQSIQKEEAEKAEFDQDAQELSFHTPEAENQPEVQTIEHQIGSYTPKTTRNLQRAHKYIDTISQQIQIAQSKIAANNEMIENLKKTEI